MCISVSVCPRRMKVYRTCWSWHSMCVSVSVCPRRMKVYRTCWSWHSMCVSVSEKNRARRCHCVDREGNENVPKKPWSLI